jgi:hypothetical protein
MIRSIKSLLRRGDDTQECDTAADGDALEDRGSFIASDSNTTASRVHFPSPDVDDSPLSSTSSDAAEARVIKEARKMNTWTLEELEAATEHFHLESCHLKNCHLHTRRQRPEAHPFVGRPSSFGTGECRS